MKAFLKTNKHHGHLILDFRRDYMQWADFFWWFKSFGNRACLWWHRNIKFVLYEIPFWFHFSLEWADLVNLGFCTSSPFQQARFLISQPFHFSLKIPCAHFNYDSVSIFFCSLAPNISCEVHTSVNGDIMHISKLHAVYVSSIFQMVCY